VQELLVDSRPLGKGPPYSKVGCIHLYNKLAVRIGNLEDVGRDELGTEGPEHLFGRSPVEGQHGEGEGCEGAARGQRWCWSSRLIGGRN